MKIITKISIGAGALAPVIGGLGWYLSNKGESKINIVKKPSYSKFWDDRVKILEEELVRLNKEERGKEKVDALVRKIDPNHGPIYFALKEDGSGLMEVTVMQRNALNNFCQNNNKTQVQDALNKKLCENIDYEILS